MVTLYGVLAQSSVSLWEQLMEFQQRSVTMVTIDGVSTEISHYGNH